MLQVDEGNEYSGRPLWLFTPEDVDHQDPFTPEAPVFVLAVAAHHDTVIDEMECKQRFGACVYRPRFGTQPEGFWETPLKQQAAMTKASIDQWP